MNDQDNNKVSDNNNNLNLHEFSTRKRKVNVVFDDNFFDSPSNPRKLNSSPYTTPLLEDDMNHLILSLAPPLQPPPPPPLQPLQEPINDYYIPLPVATADAPPQRQQPPPRPRSTRRAPTHKTREAKSEIIPPPFLWATDHKAKIHTLEYLMSNQIYTITGEVQCKKCERKYEIGFNLKEKFVQVAKFIIENKTKMHERAPDAWTNPILPTCSVCEAENSLKPVISEKKRSINWLFLLLGQMLGCCTLEQLKYFCKHTFNHRTGAKDRVLYLAYLCMCRQLDPLGPFTR